MTGGLMKDFPIKVNIGFTKRPRIGKNTVYGLTPLGKIKADSVELDGAKGSVLGALEENEIGPSTKDDIAEYLKLPPGIVERTLKKLMASQYVKIMNKAGG